MRPVKWSHFYSLTEKSKILLLGERGQGRLHSLGRWEGEVLLVLPDIVD
jgi:hypothetical protein